MKYLLIIALLFCFRFSNAQVAVNSTLLYLSNKEDKILRFKLNDITYLQVVGDRGNKIVMEATPATTHFPVELQEIPRLSDTATIVKTVGIKQERHGQFIDIHFQGDAARCYILHVPINTPLCIEHTGGGYFEANNLNSNLDIKTDASIIAIRLISGPLILNAGSPAPGKKLITIADLRPLPGYKKVGNISVVSVNHDIDISLQPSFLSVFDLSALHGNIYSDRFLKTKKTKFNGARQLVQIRTEYGNIYIRKSK